MQDKSNNTGITMDDISEAISLHKQNCQELQNEKFSNLEKSMEILMNKVDKLIESDSEMKVLETRLSIIEKKLDKKTEKIMGYVSFAVSLLLALYVLIPKFVK